MTIGTRSFAERPSYRHLVDKRRVVITGARLVDAPRHGPHTKAVLRQRAQFPSECPDWLNSGYSRQGVWSSRARAFDGTARRQTFRRQLRAVTAEDDAIRSFAPERESARPRSFPRRLATNRSVKEEAVRSIPKQSGTLRQRRDPYCGGSEPRYDEIAMMSSSDRLETTGFINAAAFPALDP